MVKYNLDIKNIEKGSKLNGKEINGILIANEISKGVYYVIDRDSRCIRIMQGDKRMYSERI